ncbi:DNA-directed RNA polymerase III subunit RPC1 [Cucumispora dikerogammari]|nr:DNA-directed RNA polymerase III subunit RPC1 [Cucumispora dikerogammari]
MKESLKSKFKFLSVKTLSPPSTIGSLEFLPTSAQLISELSTVQIKYPTLYEDNFVPIKNGPMDLRLGITGINQLLTNKRCITCNNDILGCVGHFGHIDLALPVFNSGYLKNIYNILQCICKKCGMFLIFSKLTKKAFEESIAIYNLEFVSDYEEDNRIIGFIKKFKKDSLGVLIEMSRNIKVCRFCNQKNGKLTKKQDNILYSDNDTSSGVSYYSSFATNTTNFIDKKGNNEEVPGSNTALYNKIKTLNCPGLKLRTQEIFDRYPMLHNKPKTEEEGLSKTFNLETFTATACYNLFQSENISSYYIYFLNINPVDIITTKLLILPNCLRPTTILTSIKSNEDDLTVKCAEILHINNTLISNMEKNVNLKALMADYEALQLHVNLYINSNLTGFNIKLIKGIVQRLKGKAGRFRNSLSGKRVDFSARTVITPDPFLKICQVGMPKRMAEALTVDEEVTRVNIKKLKSLILNFPNYPCVNFITKCIYVNASTNPVDSFGNSVDTSTETDKYRITQGYKEIHKKRLTEKIRTRLADELSIGDKVERQLQDNDLVLFNRQPSLHRISIMAHRVKIQNTRTLSFNESVCAPYNADFDGDEMNIHVIQTLESQAEADTLMSVNHNIINRRNNSVSVMPIQDFLTYLFKLTSSESPPVLFSGDSNNLSDFINFGDEIGDALIVEKLKGAVLRPQRLFTGFQVVDVLLFKSVLENDSPNLGFLSSCSLVSNHEASYSLRDSGKQIKEHEINHNVFKKPPQGRVDVTSSIVSESVLSDALNGCKKLPSRDVKFPKKINRIFKFKETINGCPILKLNQINFNSNEVIIKKGVLIKGTFTKSITAEFIKYLRYLDPVISNNFTNNVSRSSANLIHKMGLSIGLDDVLLDRTTYKRKILADILVKVEGLKGMSQNKREALIIKEVSTFRDHLGVSILKTPKMAVPLDTTESLQNTKINIGVPLPPSNSPLQMYKAGSKGSLLNIIQMVCAVGQQVVGGSRIPTINGRSFVHVDSQIFSKSDLLKCLVSRGLIIDSFYSGLQPLSFFCHAISGREGLVDTAVKTAETGYMQRRLIKGIEDSQLGYDGLIKFSGRIVSFSQRETTKVVSLKTDKSTCVSGDNNTSDATKLAASIKKIKIRQKKTADQLLELIITSIVGIKEKEYLKNVSSEKFCFIKNTIFRYVCGLINSIDSFSEASHIGNILKNLESLMYQIYRKRLSNADHDGKYSIINNVEFNEIKNNLKDQKLQFRIKLKNFLSSKQQYILTAISGMLPLSDKYLSPIGSLACQSIGEPGTQMTLKTFHFAGAMSMNITLGVPRLKEIINATISISTSISKIYLRSEKNLRNSKKVIMKEKFLQNLFGDEKDLIKQIEAKYPDRKTLEGISASEIKFQNYVTPTYLKDILSKMEVVYDSRGTYIELFIDISAFNKLKTAFLFFMTVGSSVKSCDTTGSMLNNKNSHLIELIINKIKKSLSCDEISYKENNYTKPLNNFTSSSGDNVSGFGSILICLTNDIIYKIQKAKSILPNLQITSFSIKRAFFQEGPSYDTINTKPLVLEGTGLHEMLSLPTTFTVTTNNIKEIEVTLGIEAARFSITKEIEFTLDSHGISVNKEHILVLADAMCTSGVVSGVTRFGIPEIRRRWGEAVSPLMMASFEQAAENLYSAAVGNVADRLEGVSERVICGKSVSVGTGSCDVALS